MKLDRLERWATVRHFRLAIALVEYGSILHAARALHLSQPTATKLLQDLEEAIGAPLFIRGRRGVTPTELGQAFVDRSRMVLAQIDHVSHAIDALGRGYAGRVAIGCVLTGSSYLVPAAIARLRSSRPDIRIKIVDGVSAELIPRLISGELDFLIGRLSDVSTSAVVAQEALFSENAIIVARRDHPLAQQPNVKLEQLAREAWLLPHTETTLRKQFDNIFYRENIDPPHATIETVSMFNILWLLRQTDLLGILPQSVAFDPAYRTEIVRLPAFEPLVLEQIGVSRLSGVGLSPAASALVEALREIMRSTSEVLAGLRGLNPQD
ncbi:LysR substrate-binding domain-containing protein [Pseudomonas chlororaphis subsp. aurantiaca]|uniref:LysR substrate-binding domain-containing protein n=1 Tax=Pseudomonas chlororaphis TaxID=587753 RepID=UPI0027DCB8D3|nr:LysR substrate-binding domain-containing protein [Pseudomonas chlororaphis]WMJ01781.1 LysR substrate-binding domain-containing protein [Pseudomonas chlororaphis subsp. aurantiaca]